MLFAVAFLVNRGSWTRSWLPMTARAARFWPRQLISFSVRAPKSILTMAPVNQPLAVAGPIFYLVLPRRWLLAVLLPFHCPSDSMRPPFPRWREGGVSCNRRREQARGLDDGTRVSRRHRTLVLVPRSSGPGPGPRLVLVLI